MKFESYISLLYIIIETFFYLVTGQIINEEKNDCTKYYNFIRGDEKDYLIDDCCSEHDVTCENGYITQINFSDRHIFEISEFTSFPYFSKLQILDLKTNSIRSLPDDLFKLPNLEELSLMANYIETIPPSVSGLMKLKALHLSGNKIKTLPDELFKLPNLEELWLNGNEIEVIPSSISGLTKLKQLYIYLNKIKILTDDLFKLSNLEELNISNNQIEAIPSSISGLTKLKILNLNNNIIKNLSDELFKLSNLEKLMLKDNKIEEIPSSISGLKNLKELNLSNNNIKSLPDELYRLPNIENVSIFGNKNLNQEDVKEKLSHKGESLSQGNKNLNQKNKESILPFIAKTSIIFGCILVLLIAILVIFMIIKKRKDKRQNESNFISIKDKNQNVTIDNVNLSQTNNIKDTLNNNNNNNVIITAAADNQIDNSLKNESTFISTSNDSSYKAESGFNRDSIMVNSNFMVNPNIMINSNAMVNSNVMVNPNGLNSNAYPGMVLLINNPQNSDYSIRNSIPIFINNQYNNNGSLDMQIPPPSYDRSSISINSVNEMTHYTIPITEENENSQAIKDEAPPEYTEIDK